MTELLIILALVLANAVFAGAEIAIVAVRKSRMEKLAEEGSGSARAVLQLRDRPEQFLATVQVGITVVSAAAAAFGGASLAEQLAPWLAAVGGLAEHAEAVALALVIAGVSYLSIIVGELVPKSLALRNAEQYALLMARPLLALSWLARPLVWLLSSSANVLLRPFGDATTFTETRHSAEELQQLVEEAAQAGTIHQGAGQIAARALELPDLTVADVMVPRQRVVMIPEGASADELYRLLHQHPHNRLPVCRRNHPDEVIGYVSVRDLVTAARDQPPIALTDVMRPAYFVPDSKRAVELLGEMQRRHMPFAIAVDEQGGMSGIVTLEDLLEELVGEIFSEHVQHAPQPIQREPDGSAVVSGLTPIREVCRALDVELPDDGHWTTVAGLCLALADRIPLTGEVLRLEGGALLEIVDASPRQVRSVRVRPPGAPPA